MKLPPFLSTQKAMNTFHLLNKIINTKKTSQTFRFLTGTLSGQSLIRTKNNNYTNQQPPQRGGAVPGPIWVGSKWPLASPWVPVTPGTPLYFFAMLPPERPQKGSTQLLYNRSPVFSFSLSFHLPFFVSSFSSFSR